MTASRLTVIGGANGSGKTTLTLGAEFFRDLPVLDPDKIGRTLQSTAASTSPVAAARQVLSSAEQHLSDGESFAVETTLAGKGYLRMMEHAQTRGFEIVLLYIGTENVEINLGRIRHRVLEGGHDVPEPEVRRRYQRSFTNLPIAAERADQIILIDNSTEEGYRLVAVLGSPLNQWFKPIPNWAVPLADKFS